MEDTELGKRSRENVLKIGYCSLDEIEEKVKAFRVMNQGATKKRYIITREPVLDSSGKTILTKAAEIDISAAKLLRRHFKGSQMFKTFQPDEGIVIISDMTSAEGVSFTMDIVTQIMNLGGAYEGFIDRVDSFAEFINLLQKSLFPKLIIIGYIAQSQVQSELLNFVRVKRVDNYLRAVELSHSHYKVAPYFPKIKQVEISQHDPKSWGRFVVEIIREYTRPYLLEEI
ncbi:hypothetical protein LEP1GSC018_3990 [Leptospira kirschneri str. 2008720114]|uniref:hypothetical protein n=1 Tax=Leptospira kirschneri TaxID=29507 RepID=UPI000297712F|nr:hypothetical protein [Leptospira kirschneri]EKP05620.1 hypothetical protein LEP1GSC018_3990 [Leptospira kirschneri str. 2008720114]